jgi:type II secretion system protein H
MRKSSANAGGFTLVELILVMLVMVVVTALAAPRLANSIRDRHLRHEALQFLALIEQGRAEAISQGVPMILTLDANAGSYGIEPKAGFTASASGTQTYQLNPDVHFEGVTQMQGVSSQTTNIEFAPDGVPDSSSIYSVRLADRFGNHMTIERTDDNWAYEILKEDGQ